MGWNPYSYQSPGVFWEEIKNLSPLYRFNYEYLTIIGETKAQNSAKENILLTYAQQELTYSVASEVSIVVSGLSGTPIYEEDYDYVLTSATETENVKIGLWANSPSSINATAGASGSNLPAGAYTYQVTAVSKNGFETDVPNTSEAITASTGLESISVSWSAVTDAVAYRLYRGDGSSVPTLIKELTETSYEDSNTTEPDGVTRPGDLSNHNICLISYNYADPTLYDIQYFYDSDDVVKFYGSDVEDFAINEPISFAAKLASINGYSNFRTIAVPNNATINEWLAALAKLEKEETLGVICLLTYNANLFTQLPNWIELRHGEGKFPFFFLGGKKSSGTETITMDTLAALTRISEDGKGPLTNENIVMFGYPTISYSFFSDNIAKVDTIDGYYGAVACAAICLAQPVYMPLTRKFLRGIAAIPKISIKDIEKYTSYGLLVPFTRYDSSIIIRHGVTTDFSSSSTREVSVVRAKHYLLRNMIDDLNAIIVGSVLNDMTTVQTVSVCQQRLESAKDARIISGYSELKASLDEEEPTKVNVRFKYRPSWPINWVLIQFAIDTTSGTISV